MSSRNSYIYVEVPCVILGLCVVVEWQIRIGIFKWNHKCSIWFILDAFGVLDMTWKSLECSLKYSLRIWSVQCCSLSFWQNAITHRKQCCNKWVILYIAATVLSPTICAYKSQSFHGNPTYLHVKINVIYRKTWLDYHAAVFKSYMIHYQYS